MYKWGICSLYICTCMYVLFLGQVKAVAGKGFNVFSNAYPRTDTVLRFAL